MNKMAHYKIEKLEKRLGSFKLILILNEFGELYFNEIANEGMNDQTLDKTITELETLGLIERFKIPGKHHKRIYQRLTENGKKIAENLSEIEKILSDVKINDL